MSLWNIIRDFIVQYITGGTDSRGRAYLANIGYTFWQSDSEYDTNDFGHVMYPIGYEFGSSSDKLYLSGSDWLATTITAICMCLIVVFAVWLVRWIFKAVSSAFLLRR